MKKKITVLVLSAMFFALCSSAEPQQPKVPRIGYLNEGSFEKLRTEAFRQGLRELGYEEGKNIVIEWRYGRGKPDPASASELVRLKVDLIVTAGGGSTRSAKEATVTIPIVMTQDTDPVRNGFVISLARPGGNITGLSRLATELSGKQVELLKEIIPGISRLAVLKSSDLPAIVEALREIELAARALGLKLQVLDVRGPKDIEPAFQAATKERS